jgi:N6-adenosine-specific RNA methylase IME4
MSDEEILNLPIGAIAAPNAYIVLWTTVQHQELGFKCLKSWGFTHKSTFIWVKTTKNSTDDEPIANMGTGHYGRHCYEPIIIGVKGKPPSFTKLGLTGIRNVIFEPRSRHSEKPQRFWDEVANPLKDKLGGNAIELFARQRREGCDCWGSLELETI